MILRLPGRPGSIFLWWVVLAVLAGASRSASANPLDEEACRKLQTEKQALAGQGVDKNLEKGADWAKANLKVADIILIKRYLDVFEQIKFRCEKVMALIERAEPDDENDDDEASNKEPAAPDKKDAASIDQVSPAKENAVKPVAVPVHGQTVSARETKADLETKPAVKNAKPVAKDTRAAADTKAAAKDSNAAKDTRPKGTANAAVVKTNPARPAAEQ